MGIREKSSDDPLKTLKFILRWMLSGAGIGYLIGLSVDQYFWIGTGSVLGTLIGIDRYLRNERNRNK